MKPKTGVAAINQLLRLFFSVVLFVTLGAVLGTQATHAATFVVTNTSDAGAGSLRNAINQANANPGADMIQGQIISFRTNRLFGNGTDGHFDQPWSRFCKRHASLKH